MPNSGGAFTPQVVVDPTNPNTLAMVVAQPAGILAQIGFDGGVSWTKIRDTNSPFNTNPAVSNVPQTFPGDLSKGMLLDPTVAPTNSGLPRSSRGYTNASEPTIAFTRSGSVFIAYLQHNAAKTSGGVRRRAVRHQPHRRDVHLRGPRPAATGTTSRPRPRASGGTRPA